MGDTDTGGASGDMFMFVWLAFFSTVSICLLISLSESLPNEEESEALETFDDLMLIQ